MSVSKRVLICSLAVLLVGAPMRASYEDIAARLGVAALCAGVAYKVLNYKMGTFLSNDEVQINAIKACEQAEVELSRVTRTHENDVERALNGTIDQIRSRILFTGLGVYLSKVRGSRYSLKSAMDDLERCHSIVRGRVRNAAFNQKCTQALKEMRKWKTYLQGLENLVNVFPERQNQDLTWWFKFSIFLRFFGI